VPGTTELYSIEFFDATAGGNGWQPIESQIRGVNGENFPNDALIPWAGSFGTNHQYIASEGTAGTAGQWKSTGPGPHTPANDTVAAPDNGIYMWLGGHTSASWLYAKWDFGFNLDRAHSALRLTQITPEPASAMMLLLGIPLLRRRKARD
jgi:hypothetical protein